MSSLRVQLTRRLLLFTSLIFLGSWIILYLAAREALIHQFDVALRAQAQAVCSLVELENGKLRIEVPERLPQQFSQHRPKGFFIVQSLDGSQSIHSPSLGSDSLIVPALVDERPVFLNQPLPHHHAGRSVTFRFLSIPDSTDNPGQQPTPLIVTAASSRSDLDETLSFLLVLIGIGGLLLLGSILWFIPRLLRRGLQPLDTLAQQASEIDANSLSRRLPEEKLPTELFPIANRLNGLLARLEDAFERERRVNADLAHELRTPIAELRSVAENALRWPQTRDRQTDEDLLAIAVQLERTVTLMLSLARSESGQIELNLTPVRLDELLKDLLAGLDPALADRQLVLACELPMLERLTDIDLARHTLRNLLENAVEYSPQGGRIGVVIERNTPTGDCIVISNQADALTQEDLGRFFQRYWRKEASRSTSAHLGLGLSLVHAYARTLSWDIDARLEKTKRLEIRLSLH